MAIPPWRRAPPPGPSSTPREQLHALAQEVWETYVGSASDRLGDGRAGLATFAATSFGDRRFDATVPDLHPEAIHEAQRRIQGQARALAAIDRGSLGFDDRVTYDVLEHFARKLERLAPLELHEVNLTQMNEDVHSDLANLGEYIHTIRTPEDARTLQARYAQAPALLAQREANLRAGQKSGRLDSKVVVDCVLAQLDAQLAELADEPRTARSVYLRTLRESPLEGEAREVAQRALTGTLRRRLAPALQRFARFLREEYVGRDPESEHPGLAAMPGGEAMYEGHIEACTDGARSPADLHAKGLEEVARLQRKLRQTAGEVLNRPTRDGEKLVDLLREVQNHPGDRIDSEERAFEAVKALTRLALDELPALWGLSLPEQYRELNIKVDRLFPGAAYQRGSDERTANFLWNPDAANTPSELPSLVFHEVTHHLQFVASQLGGDRPELERRIFSTATTEGEALRTEAMAIDAGLYEKAAAVLQQVGGNGATLPLLLFGTYNTEMMRAVRLVVDTGLHHLGWSREQAIDFMAENLAMPRARLEAQVDRYIGLPGQALSYMVGKLEFDRLQEKAEQALGDRFDLPRFNRALLAADGAALPIVERVVDEHIRRERER